MSRSSGDTYPLVEGGNVYKHSDEARQSDAVIPHEEIAVKGAMSAVGSDLSGVYIEPAPIIYNRTDPVPPQFGSLI